MTLGVLRQADFYRSRGDLQKALSPYREAEKRKGVDPIPVWLKIAGILEDSGEMNPALAWMEKAAAAAEGDERTRENSGSNLHVKIQGQTLTIDR